jgi:regulator of sirC expression with transglutaminase-like and TPR domain
MKRRSLLLAAASSACGAGAPRRPFSESALAVAREAATVDAGTERFYWRELDRLTTLARATVQDRGASLATRLSALIFEDRGFVREVDDTDLRFVLLPGVLRDRRGSCVGLGSLYLALTEALGIAAHGVLRPGHFYVRLEHGDPHTNVELLRRGEVMPDDWYERRFPAPGGAVREYGRPLSYEETLGVVEYNVGNQRRREHRLEAACAAYARAVRHFPELAEAHASLGTALHLLGRVDEARDRYLAAQRLNPALPNLEHNLSLLESERSP